MYVVFHSRCLLFLSDFNWNWSVYAYLLRVLNVEIHKNVFGSWWTSKWRANAPDKNFGAGSKGNRIYTGFTK